MQLLFKGIEKSTDEKKFGYSNQKGVGFQTYIHGEVLKCEYEKDDEKKIKKTASGNKKFIMKVKVSRQFKKADGTLIDTGEVAYVSCFEKEEFKGENFSFPAIRMKDFQPETKEENGKTVIVKPKYIRLDAKDGSGGTGFARLTSNSYITKSGNNKGKINSNIKIQGANLTKVYKKDGSLVYDGFGGEQKKFVVDEFVKASFKGFFEKINDTEKFLNNNLDEKNKTLRVRFFYAQSKQKENSKELYDTSPVTLVFKYEDIDEDIKGKFGLIKFLKDEAPGNVCFVKGHYERIGILSKEPKKKERGFGKKQLDGFDGYETVLVVSREIQDEGWVEFDYSLTGFKGDYIMKKDDKPLVAEIKKSDTEEKLSEKKITEVDVDVSDIELEDDIKDDLDDEIDVPETKDDSDAHKESKSDEEPKKEIDESIEESPSSQEDDFDDLDIDGIDFDDIEM